MDKLIVKNFGPIKEISIDVNEVNIFIGPTSSGKSVVAKLIAIFKSPDFLRKGSFKKFTDLLIEYNIDFEIQGFTEITYRIRDTYWSISNNLFDSNSKYEVDIQEIYAIDKYQKGSIDINDSPSLISLLTYIERLPDKFLIRVDDDSAAKEFDFSEFRKYFYETYKDVIDDIGICSTIYIPAERILLSMIGESLFGLMKNDVSIAQCLKEFGAMFEIARKHLKSFDVSFLQAKYEYADKNNYVTLSNGIKIKLEAASSGFQSLIPLMMVVKYFAVSKRQIDNCFIIEEPESNLYPTMQKSLVEFIIGVVNQSNDKLIITTHSPYTLTSIDNLIQAKNAFSLHPELKNEINKVVPENLWIDFNSVSCYYFEDGGCRSTLDNEMQSIGPSNIDDVSIELGRIFDHLLDLKYHKE